MGSRGDGAERLSDTDQRDWYAEQAAVNGWSGKVLDHHIATDLRRRIASAASNFHTHLAGADSDLALEIVRDPYVFDFLNRTARATEHDVEQAMMARLQDTLLELGSGFAFVGRQVRLDVNGGKFFLDLLLFHVVQLRYVLVELKVDKFRPEHAGQLQFSSRSLMTASANWRFTPRPSGSCCAPAATSLLSGTRSVRAPRRWPFRP